VPWQVRFCWNATKSKHQLTHDFRDETKEKLLKKTGEKMKIINKPDEGEYASYTIMYIGLLPNDGLVLEHLSYNANKLVEFIQSLPAEKLTYRYAENKWTIKEILVHIIDDERIYVYRALRYARNDKINLPGFEQDDYAFNSFANERDMKSIIDEYISVRDSTIAFFNGLDNKVLKRTGIADGNLMSVRAAAYHIAGHELHHINIMKEKYL